MWRISLHIWRDVRGGKGYSAVRHLMICFPWDTWLKLPSRGGWDGWGMLHAWREREIHRGFCRKPWTREYLDEMGVNLRLTLSWILRKWGVAKCIGFVWQDKNQRQAYINMLMNICVPQNKGNFLTSWASSSFWGGILLHLITVHNFCTVGRNVWEREICAVKIR